VSVGTLGLFPKSSWIAYVKEQLGMPVRRARNRVFLRKDPGPTEKREAIIEALRAAMV